MLGGAARRRWGQRHNFLHAQQYFQQNPRAFARMKKGTADAEALVLLPADGVCGLRLVCSISLIPGAAFIMAGLLPWG